MPGRFSPRKEIPLRDYLELGVCPEEGLPGGKGLETWNPREQARWALDTRISRRALGQARPACRGQPEPDPSPVPQGV